MVDAALRGARMKADNSRGAALAHPEQPCKLATYAAVPVSSSSIRIMLS
jgi:hypothetical protein